MFLNWQQGQRTRDADRLIVFKLLDRKYLIQNSRSLESSATPLRECHISPPPWGFLSVPLPLHCSKAPSGAGSGHYPGFTITFRHTTLGRTSLTRDRPVAEASTWQHTTHTRDKHPCLPAGFEPATSAGEHQQTHTLDRAATGIGSRYCMSADIQV